jgi:hypothetical protein
LAGDGHDAPLSAPAAMLPCGLPERRWSPCFLHVAAAGRPVQPVPQARELQARGNTPAKDSPARELGLGRIGVGFGCRRFAAGVRPFSRRLFLRLPFALCWSGVFFLPVTGFWGQDWDSFGVAPSDDVQIRTLFK